MITNKQTSVLLALQSFFAVFALMIIGNISTTNLISLILFLLCFLFFRYSRVLLIPDVQCRKISGQSYLLALLFTLLYLAASFQDLTASLDSKLFRIIYCLMCGIGLFYLFFYTLTFLFQESRYFATKQLEFSNRKLPLPTLLFFFSLLLLCWMPYFLKNFPGIMTPDSLRQFAQITGVEAYSNHHPWVHTMLFKLCYEIGFWITGNQLISIAFYTVFQMTLMALLETYLLNFLYALNFSKKVLFAVFLFYAVVPYNGLFAATIWKDILFSGSVLLFTIQLFKWILHLQNREARIFHKVDYFLFFISGTALCLLRSNGWYAFLCLLPFLLYFFREHLKSTALILCTIVIAVLLVKGPLMTAYSVTQPDFVESLSIPLQQIARVIANQRTLSEAQTDLLRKTADISYVSEYYNPVISDPIKALVRYGHPDYLRNHKSDYFLLWIQLGFQYPADYLNAFLDQTKGYWFPSSPSPLTYEGISQNDLGLVCTPLLQGKIVIKVNELLAKSYTIFPLYGFLWSMGGFLWIAIVLIFNCRLQKSRKKMIVFLPAVAVIATLFLATPVANDFRYAYPLVLCMPLLLLTGLCFE